MVPVTEPQQGLHKNCEDSAQQEWGCPCPAAHKRGLTGSFSCLLKPPPTILKPASPLSFCPLGAGPGCEPTRILKTVINTDFHSRHIIFFSGLSSLSNDTKEKVLFGASLELLSKIFQVPFLNTEQTQASNTSDLEIIHIACFFTEIMFGVLHGK